MAAKAIAGITAGIITEVAKSVNDAFHNPVVKKNAGDEEYFVRRRV